MTLSSFLSQKHIEWSLDQVKELVTQCACAILSYQRTLGMEHGDMHLNNLMINANETLVPTFA